MFFGCMIEVIFECIAKIRFVGKESGLLFPHFFCKLSKLLYFLHMGLRVINNFLQTEMYLFIQIL